MIDESDPRWDAKMERVERAQNGEGARQRAWLEDRRAQTLIASRPV